MIKIGFLDCSNVSWSAGASYSRSMVHALASAADDRCSISVLSSANSSLSELPDGVQSIRIDEPRLTPSIIRAAIKKHSIDVLLPITEVLFPDTECALIGWIPDFQHHYLPHYFTPEQRAQRDRHFGYLVDNCDGMMFSSQAVLADFHELYPSFSKPSASVHFPSSLAYTAGIANKCPTDILKKYNLPSGFALVVNQFWKHKNHRLIVDAVAQARIKQPHVRIVMVGMLSDSRDVSNPHLSELMRKLSVERLHENISILGEIPFDDLIALLRSAIEVIQPSEFEGWNTTVQDALAFGKPVACSDIPTHREQAVGAFFFPSNDPTPLAAHLEALDWSRKGWTGELAETTSLEAERSRGRQWAKNLIDLCEMVSQEYRTHMRKRKDWINPIDELRANPLTYIDYLENQNLRLTRNQERLEDANKQLQEARRNASLLREQLRESHAETQVALQKYWKEKSKPFRFRLQEEWMRICGKLNSNSK